MDLIGPATAVVAAAASESWFLRGGATGAGEALTPAVIHALARQTAGQAVLDDLPPELTLGSPACGARSHSHSLQRPTTPTTSAGSGSTPSKSSSLTTAEEGPPRRIVTPGRGGYPQQANTSRRAVGWKPRTQEDIAKERRMGSEALAKKLHADAQLKQARLWEKQFAKAKEEDALLVPAAEARYTHEAHVNRLNAWKRQMNDKRAKRREDQEKEEEDLLTDIPEINEYSKQLASISRKPVWERTEDQMNAKQEKLELQRQAAKEDLLEGATFKPAITRKAEELPDRSLSHHEHWATRRRERLQEERARQRLEEVEGCTFHPATSSTKGASTSSAHAHERLHRDAVRRQCDKEAQKAAPVTPQRDRGTGESARSATPQRNRGSGGASGGCQDSPGTRSKSPAARSKSPIAGGKAADNSWGVVLRPGSAQPLDAEDRLELELDELLFARADWTAEAAQVDEANSASVRKLSGGAPRRGAGGVSPSPARTPSKGVSPSPALRAATKVRTPTPPRTAGRRQRTPKSGSSPGRRGEGDGADADQAGEYQDVFNHISARVH